MVGVTDEQADGQEIIEPQNAFDVRMGLTQKMTLRLENLNTYDYWYYSDIVTSSDVRVTLTADDYDAGNDTLYDSTRVAVDTKSVRQRDGDGGAFGTLNVEIKYRRYDRV